MINDAAAVTIAVSPGNRGHWTRLQPWIVPLLVLSLLAVVLRALEFEIGHLRYHDIARAFADVARGKLLLGACCTMVAYLALPNYDDLALSYAEHRLPWRRVAYGSTVTYGISQTLGFPALTGNSLRLRLWSAWGLSTSEIAKAVAFSGATFTIGIVTLSGVVGVLESSANLERLRLPVGLLRATAAVCLLIAALYVAWSLFGQARVLRIRGYSLSVPSPRLVMLQFCIAVTDWPLAALVLFVLLPDGHGLSFATFVGAFVLAQSAGLISHVPGGIGVFETLIVLQVGGVIPTESLLGSLLAYRVVFYLVPFAVAVLLLVVHEVRRQRTRLGKAATAVSEQHDRWAEPLLPSAIGWMTVLGGALLLLSRATPSAHGRVALLAGIFPLGVIELSHFAGSIAGAGLVVLGWALTRRLDGAYFLARVMLLLGVVASLLRGLDYNSAIILAVVLALLVAGRHGFTRRSSLLAEPMTLGWIAAIMAVIAVSIWVGTFSYRHVEYSTELWWQFAERGDAPRFLRASAGAAMLLGVVSVLRLLRPAAPDIALAGAEQLALVQRLLPTIDETSGALALLGDKHVLTAAGNNGFLMFGISGRTWVSLGDPLGSDTARRELSWRFREAADEHGAAPVFYEVSANHLPLYIDLGLTLLKMGEEALVPLADFSLDGRDRRGLRRTQRDFQKVGATFEIVAVEQVPALLPELRDISDAWLATKSTREKGFSLGGFNEEYLRHFPHAIVRVNERIVAFANIWTGSGRELSIDLMRYSPDAPPAVMEYLFIELMLWGRQQGFDRMSLGMAPLSGLGARALSPRWNRLGGLLYRHGEHFYHFQGLRSYKDKFDPIWEPRYLATPAGLALPRVLADVTSLISGGITGLFAR